MLSEADIREEKQTGIDQQPLTAWMERIRSRPPRFVSFTTALPLHRDRPAE
jgi:hypothetical protein